MELSKPVFKSDILTLDADRNVSLEELVHYAKPGMKVDYSSHVEERVIASRNTLIGMVKNGKIIYGVNTSMGGFVDRLVPIDKAAELQNNLINAVATNVGNYFDEQTSRAAFLARIVSLARGNSALSLDNFQRMINIYNAGIIPCIPEKGSLGTSGDLGPLAAIALCLTGQWKAKLNGRELSGKDALAELNLEPLALSYKEGLALINGTSAMVGLAAINVSKSTELLRKYIQISALTFESLCAKSKPFDPRVHQLKPHKGQQDVSEMLWNALKGSEMTVDETEVSNLLSEEMTDDIKQAAQTIEDSYSIRCTPQVLGPVLDSLRYVHDVIENELNSSNDNPLITPHDNEVFHNGHFHGQYVSMAMDQLNVSLIVLCNLSDRRIDRFLTGANSNGLPPFLCKENPGLRLGLMGGQFMSASLTAENRSLATPVSIQTLTSTADFQDIVSFGLVAARRVRDVLVNTKYVVAFELLCACQAADIRGASKLSPEGYSLYSRTRKYIPYLDKDIVLTEFLESMVKNILENEQE